jgi:hypothetical protein
VDRYRKVKSEGKRGGRELLEKRRGRVHLYTWRRTGLADEVGSDAMPVCARTGRHSSQVPITNGSSTLTIETENLRVCCVSSEYL